MDLTHDVLRLLFKTLRQGMSSFLSPGRAAKVQIPSTRFPRLTLKGPLQTPGGPRGRAGTGFEPGGQIGEMDIPATVDGGIVGIPVLPLADASVGETKTSALVFRGQFKGDRRGARRKSLPAITETMGRLTHEDSANFDRIWRPLKPDRSPRAQIDLGFLHKPTFQLCWLGQGLEDALWSGVDKQFFLK
jgi:hypothetical protein